MEDIRVVDGTAHIVRVDWRQLRRSNIPESAPPPGSAVQYREPTLWERDKKYVIAALVVIGLQFLWVAVPLWQCSRKRKALLSYGGHDPVPELDGRPKMAGSPI